MQEPTSPKELLSGPKDIVHDRLQAWRKRRKIVREGEVHDKVATNGTISNSSPFEGKAPTDYPYHWIVAEADDVASRVGGFAFAPVPMEEAIEEIELLRQVGEPDLECEDFHPSTTNGSAQLENNVDYLWAVPRRIQVPVSLTNGSRVSVLLEAGESYSNAAKELCTGLGCEHDPFPLEATLRAYVVRKHILGDEECRRPPDFASISAGRLRSSLPANVEGLLSFFLRSSGPTPAVISAGQQCATSLSLEHTLFAADQDVLSNFSVLVLRMRDRWRAPERDESEARTLMSAASRVLDLGGAIVMQAPSMVWREEETEADCFLWLFASAALAYVWGSDDHGGACEQTEAQQVHHVLSILSLSWTLLEAGEPFAHLNPYGVGLDLVIREHERWISIYSECVGAKRQQHLQQLVPIKYFLRQPLPEGRYAAETALMEPLEPDGHTILGMQYGRHNPVSYRVLPFIPSFRALFPALGRRRVLVDAGAASFRTGTKWLLDLYSGSLRFTEVLLIDSENIDDIPPSYERAYNITKYKRMLRVGTRRPENDLVSLLTGGGWGLAEADFVVLKFDCDFNVHESSVEWGFLADLVYTPAALRLVDEVFIEMHFFYPMLWRHNFNLHTMWQHFDVLRQLRDRGIAVHAWP